MKTKILNQAKSIARDIWLEIEPFWSILPLVIILFVLMLAAAIAEGNAIAECRASGGEPQYETQIIYIQNGNVMQPMPIEVYAGCDRPQS